MAPAPFSPGLSEEGGEGGGGGVPDPPVLPAKGRDGVEKERRGERLWIRR